MRKILKAWWPVVREHRGSAIATLILMVLIVLVKASAPFVTREILKGLESNDYSCVYKMIWLVVVSVITYNVLVAMFDVYSTLFETRATRDMTRISFEVIQRQSMRFLDDSYAGSLVATESKFHNAFIGIWDNIVENLGRSVVMICVTLLVFAWERPWLALGFSVWTVAFCLFCVWVAKLRMKWDVIAAQKGSKASAFFSDSLSNSLLVKSFAKEREEQERFRVITEDSYKHRLKAWMLSIPLARAQTIISSAFEVSVLVMLVRGWRDGTITVADFVFFQTYVFILMSLVWNIGGGVLKVFRLLADAQEMADIYAQEPEVQDLPGAGLLDVERGEIEFRGVEFSYSKCGVGQNGNVHRLNLGIEPGEIVAIAGHSGAGKSTLVKLLLHLFNLDSGQILIDGQDIANVQQSSLREQIAVVPQEIIPLHRSIKENIAFVRPDATDEEIVEAARLANALEFIAKHGWDTVVGERGLKLSGGERQRIALARAFLANAKILILDEATSSVDSVSESKIQSAIAELIKGRTCIIIAHRLSTIMRADRIVVMKDGSIVQVGTHAELIETCDEYIQLWEHQVGGYINE